MLQISAVNHMQRMRVHNDEKTRCQVTVYQKVANGKTTLSENNEWMQLGADNYM